MQAIQAATTSAAELLQWDEDVGSLTPGHYADMIAVPGDPLTDITILADVRGVMKGGVVVKTP
jgi:imidazolonepropionase-like amidohydrolase